MPGDRRPAAQASLWVLALPRSAGVDGPTQLHDYNCVHSVELATNEFEHGEHLPEPPRPVIPVRSRLRSHRKLICRAIRRPAKPERQDGSAKDGVARAKDRPAIRPRYGVSARRILAQG